MATKTKRTQRNSKTLNRCEYCTKYCNCRYIHMDCIFEFLEKNGYIVFDLNLSRIFQFGGKPKWT